MKRILFCLVFLLSGLTLCAQEIYEFTVTNADGKSVALSNYRGKVLLIVNTATRCGFTPQYKELEALYEQYAAQGLEILDFPCNQFGQQAPGTAAEIRQFCSTNFDVRFSQFDKIDVNGPAKCLIGCCANKTPTMTRNRTSNGTLQSFLYRATDTYYVAMSQQSLLAISKRTYSNN